jgi:hypothetical protein
LNPNFLDKPGYIDGYFKESQDVHKLAKKYNEVEFGSSIRDYYLLNRPDVGENSDMNQEAATYVEISSIVPFTYFSADIHTKVDN